MKRAFSTILILSLCVGFAGCKHAPAPDTGEGTAHASDSIKVDPDKLKFIKTEVLQESDAAATVALTGRVAFDEDHTQRVSSPLDGRATSLLVKPGDKVKVGQSLIELASSQVAQFQSDTQKAVQDADIAQRTVDRARKLRNDGAVSDKEMAQAEADLSKAKSEVARTSAQIGSLGISASNPGAGAALHARVAGTVVERNVLVGQEVRADAPLPLLTISNLDVVWVLADVYEQDLGLVKPGATVAVHVAAYPGEAFVGTIGHLGDVVDPNSRTVKLRCVVPNPDNRLKPEMFAKVELTETNGKKVLVVPSRAVLNDSEHSRVVLSTGENVFAMRVVQVGPEVDGKVRVLDGLKPGDRVVTEGAIFLKNELDNK
ncbi:MAG: efflux RND transporter periplasmic adaptor subunit [Polyangiaceae bacterium]